VLTLSAVLLTVSRPIGEIPLLADVAVATTQPT
jgi:hypothetical protein